MLKTVCGMCSVSPQKAAKNKKGLNKKGLPDLTIDNRKAYVYVLFSVVLHTFMVFHRPITAAKNTNPSIGRSLTSTL